MPRILIAAAVLAALTACAADRERFAAMERERAEAKLARLIGERSAGAPQDCLDTRQTNGFEPVGARTLLYFQGNTVWRNDLEGQCAGLRSGDALVTDQRTGRLCRGDFAKTLNPAAGGQVTGNCVIGRFVPYRPG